MRTPAAAFAWEIWRRNRMRLIAIIGLVLAFALVYPPMCALAGFNSSNALDEFARIISPAMDGKPMPLRMLRLFYFEFLIGGPAIAMLLSLLYVTWMFTFIEFNPNKKDPITFPARIFTLPVSTSFVYWWLFLGGIAAIGALYSSWVYFVPMPRLEVFGIYQNCFGWMTLLALAQAITWSLAAWPIVRLLVLNGLLVCFLGSQSWSRVFESPLLLPALFISGAALARVGLQKMRHSQWQGLYWKWRLPALFAPAELRGPKTFSSPAQAQLWFEWRRFARLLCVIIAILAIMPMFIHVLVRWVAGLGPIQDNTLAGFAIYLVALPPVIYFCYSMSPGSGDQSFLEIRPLTAGKMSMATLKAAAVGAGLSWVAVFAAMSLIPLLGNFRGALPDISVGPEAMTAIVIGLIFFTWRIMAVNLWSARSGKHCLAGLPAFALMGGLLFLFLAQSGILNPVFWRWAPFVSCLLACLVAAKLMLAFLAFRVALNQRLIAPSAVVKYLAIWVLLIAVLLPVMLILPHAPSELMLPVTLCVILFVPLARIAFAPIMLARARHT